MSACHCPALLIFCPFIRATILIIMPDMGTIPIEAKNMDSTPNIKPVVAQLLFLFMIFFK